ncbi:hypothetical protein BASA62_006687 [Batrachochytrium salamandrivorans]|nr:hypothetical protein BASA62_006687 [Batrachochytrium salamandrivorans]
MCQLRQLILAIGTPRIWNLTIWIRILKGVEVIRVLADLPMTVPNFQIYREPLGLSASAVRGSPRFGGGNTNGGGLVSAGSSSSLHIVTLPSAVSTAESIDTVNESDVGLVVNMDDNHNDVETGTTHAMVTSRLATTTPSGGHQRVASPYIPSNLHP